MLSYQFYKFGNMQDFFAIVSNPVIFFPILDFTIIKGYNIMACNLDLYAIAIKCFFGMQQPHVWCFL